MFDLDRVMITGQHVRYLHHAGRAAHGHHLGAAGYDIVALALAILAESSGCVSVNVPPQPQQ